MSGPRAAAAFALVFLLSCATSGVGDDELAQPPIAALYWSWDEAQSRANAAEGAGGPRRMGVARAGDIGRLLGAGGGAGPDLAARRYPGRLSLIDPATGRVEPIEAAPPGAIPLAWSSDRSRLLLVATRLGRAPQVYEYRLDEQELRPVTSGPAGHTAATYGPDGRLVVVTQVGPQHSRVDLLTESWRFERTLFHGPQVTRVSWSPRGDMMLLAVLAPRGGARSDEVSWMLFAASTDDPGWTWPPTATGALKPLGRGRDPVFGADGEWFVYSARIGDGWRLRRMRGVGGGRLAVGRGVRDEFEPALSPDGSLVAYVSEDAGFDRLFVRRVDGSGDRLLLPDGVVARPVW
jgi:Tol biopolymer transport system component